MAWGGGSSRLEDGRQSTAPESVSCQVDVLSMRLTEHVVARRAEGTVMSECALCDEEAKCRRNEHLLFECTSTSVVKLRKEVEAAAEKKVSRLVKPVPVREAIMVPWRLDEAGRPPNVEVMAEVEAALGTVLGAATPAEGFKRLVSRQRPGAATTGGNWAGVGAV